MESKSEVLGLDSLDAKEQESSSNIICLNVGGTRFETTKATLEKSGYFKALLSGKFGDKQADGSYFIDRNGRYFEYLLDYMRCGYVAIPSKKIAIIQLEAEYLQINIDLKKIEQRMKLPELEVHISNFGKDLWDISINRQWLEHVYGKYKMENIHQELYRKHSEKYRSYNKIIDHLINEKGYRIHQITHTVDARTCYIYILRPSIPDVVIVSTK